ncbi:helix-turn-helix domain-containing protein [Micromonospora sp. NPDC049559]|uniref:helix-turn-helix domain-containing protein n=1 Tax=Micromonospora sp. NPDC049559 TaxID=3155923 RepID=UPI00342EF513
MSALDPRPRPSTPPKGSPEPTRNPGHELPVGRRVAYWRGRRNLSQQHLADRLGKSKSWVEKVERGARRLDRFSVLHEIAEALRIDVQQLVSTESKRMGGRGRIETEGIRAALERYAVPGPRRDGEPNPPELPELAKAVNHAWLTCQRSGYDSLARSLPRLILDAQASDGLYHDPEAAHLLAQAYQIASAVLLKLGEAELAWLAADRSTAVAARADDPLLVGTATGRAGGALLALGRPGSALAAHEQAAHRLAPGGEELGGTEPTGPARLSVRGWLFLQGALAVARLGNAARARELLQAAEGAANALGTDQDRYWTSFGPTNVRLHRIAAAVELGEGGHAIEIHTRIDPRDLGGLPPERRAQHLLDLARAYLQTGDTVRAGRALVDGERVAPAEIRYRPAARATMTDLLRAIGGTPPGPVPELAAHMGVTI